MSSIAGSSEKTEVVYGSSNVLDREIIAAITESAPDLFSLSLSATLPPLLYTIIKTL